MKIIYHIGNKIDSDTVVKKGEIVDGDFSLILESGYKIKLDELEYVDYYRVNGLGTMIKLQIESDTVFLCVPRLFINIGTGFVIVNTLATVKLKKKLETFLHNEKNV